MEAIVFLLALVFAPFLAVLLPLLVAQRGRTWIAIATAVAPLLALSLLLSQTSAVLAGEVKIGRAHV